MFPTRGEDGRFIRDDDGNIILTHQTITAGGFSWGGPRVLESTLGVDATSFCIVTSLGSESFAGCAEQHTAQGMSAQFTNPAEPHDGTAFDARIELSVEPAAGFSYKVFQGDPSTGRESVLQVTNGTVTRARRDGANQNRRWIVTIAPSGDEAVTLTLPATTDCAALNAICSADGAMLQEAVTKTVPGPDNNDEEEETEQATQAAALTVAYTAPPPPEHDGSTPFTFAFSFNETLHADYSYKTMRDRSLTVMQGGTKLTPHVRRMVKGSNRSWEATVTPAGNAAISIALGPTGSCSETGAMCTEEGTALSNALPANTVQGPVGVSVADASVQEAAGATLDFAVTLSRAASAAVTVDYATSDGTATAGSDYTETSGTLTFAVGEREKTVAVPVLDDDHDEGSETFTLTLSNVEGNAYLADAEAIGTIENSDHMPRAWLARFGRTVAEQVIEAVEGRFSAPRAAGVEMTLAGQRIGSAGAAPEDSGSPTGAGAGARATLAGEREAHVRLEAMTKWLQGTEAEGDAEGGRAGYRSRTVTPRDLLTGTSFAVTGEAKAGGTVSLWGRGAVTRFDGREGDLTLDGEVASAMLGADWARDRWTAGLLVSRSVGEGGYRGASAGTVESTLTGFFPYGRYAVNDRVTVWGMAGYGAGELTLTPEGQTPMRTDMDLAMGAVGVRGVAVEAPADGGFELAVKTDAMAVRTTSEKVAGLVAAEADVTRVRLGLEGTWRGLEAGGGALAPRVEIGVRHDGGDAETGFGLDLGGGLAWRHAASGVSAEIRGRGLLTHESKGFRDRGISGSFAWDPSPASGRGPSLTLTQSVGASASGGMDALLGQRHLAGLAANDNGDELGNRRLELRMDYGFSVLADRFTLTPEAGVGLSNGWRDYRIGWRLTSAVRGDPGFEVNLDATRREPANDAGSGAPVEHGVMLRSAIRW